MNHTAALGRRQCPAPLEAATSSPRLRVLAGVPPALQPGRPAHNWPATPAEAEQTKRTSALPDYRAETLENVITRASQQRMPGGAA